MSVNDMKLIKQLLEAGVHFGHQTNRWNPKMKPFIFGEKSGIYIIDLEKTNDLLDKARAFIRDVARAGSYILFVGTKKQAQSIVKEQAEKCGMFYVNTRWLGGTLTNFSTIRKSVDKLEKLEKSKVDGTYDVISKKERSHRDKEIEKLNRNLAGIRNMNRLPGVVFVVDSKNEDIAVKEAKKLSIPVIALVDTNCNPDLIDYVVPGNDDALKAIALITSLITESVIDGRNQFIAGSEEKPVLIKKEEPVKPVVVEEKEVKEEKKEKEEKEEKEEESLNGDIKLKAVEKDKKKLSQRKK